MNTGVVPSTAFKVTLPPFPYPGLRPFDTGEWPIFFGREPMVDEVLGRLIDRHFVVVHGDSGCGKSSLIRAGVLPRLEQDHARGGIHWRTCVTQPREAPLRSLAKALAKAVGDGSERRITDIRRVLNFGTDAAPRLVDELGLGPTDHVCVLIDQFEELFDHTKSHGPDEGRLLTQFLVGLLANRQDRLYVVLTMRSEFLGSCAQFPGLAEAVNEGQYLLPRMSHENLLRAIREPATLYGGHVSQDFAERLIVDAEGEQDQLPLIQHGLMMVCRAVLAPITGSEGAQETPRQPWKLDHAAYVDSVDLRALLSSHADAVCARADAIAPGVAEPLFRALIDINADGRAIRRPQPLEQLAAVTHTDLATLTRVIDVFRAGDASFLQPYGTTPLEPATQIDISHEALIRCWKRIDDPKDGWLAREFQDGLIWRSLLVQADSFERDRSNLLSVATAKERQAWMTPPRNEAWARRYNGGWKRVEQLIVTTLDSAEVAAAHARSEKRKRIATWLAIVAASVASIAIVAYYASSNSSQVTAARLWDRLDFTSSPLSDDELSALWQLSGSRAGVRRAFLEEFERDSNRALRLIKNPEAVLRALYVRWPAERAEEVFKALVVHAPKLPNVGGYELSNAFRSLAARLNGPRRLASFGAMVQQLRASTDPIEQGVLSSAAEALAQVMSSEEAAEVLSGDFPPDVEGRGSPEAAYRAAAARVSGGAARAVYIHVSGLLVKSEDGLRTTQLVEVLRSIQAPSPNQPPAPVESARMVATDFVARLLRGKNDIKASSALDMRQSGLALLLDRLTTEDRSDIARIVLEGVQQALSADAAFRDSALTNLAVTLKGLRDASAPEAAALLDTLTARTDTVRSGTELVLRTAAILTDAAAVTEIERFVNEIVRSSDRQRLGLLAAVCGSAAGTLSGEFQARGLDLLIAGMSRATSAPQLQALAAAMRDAPAGAAHADAAPALLAMHRRWRAARNSNMKEALAEVMVALAPRIAPDQVGQVVDRLVPNILDAPDADRATLINLTGGLGAASTPEALRAAYAPLFVTLSGARSERQQADLVPVISNVPGPLSAAMATAPIGEIARRYVADANQPHTLSLLHGAIADKLPDGERVEAAAPIIEAMRSAQGSDALNALADLLQSMWRENLQCHPKTASVCALVARATAELAQQVAQSSDQNSNQQYAFEMLLKRIGPEQAPEIVALLQKLRSPDESDPRFDGGLYLALGRLSPRDARNHFKLIFDKLAAGAPRQGLATEQALQEVTARLADDQMPADLAEVLRQYSRTKDKARLSPAVTTALNAAEGALRSRPDGEAPILAGVGPLLSRAAYLIQQEEASNTPGSMDKAWTSSANRVLPALQAVLEGLAGPDRPPDPATLDPLVKGLTEPDPDPLDLQAIVEAIPAVASRLSPNQAARVQGSLRSIIGWTSDISIAAPAAVAFRGFAATQPAPTRTQSILALLKYPGGGDVTSALLEGQGVEPAAGSNDSKLELQHYLQALEQNPSSSASVSAMPPCPAPYRRGLSCR